MSSGRSRRPGPTPSDAWQREDEPARVASANPDVRRAPVEVPAEVQTEVRRAFTGTATQRERLVTTLTRAAEAYDRHRYEEALRLARIVADGVPGVGAVQELLGLAAYRAQRFPIARTALWLHFKISGDPQHLPAVMDCERASRKFRAAARTFEELTESSPSPDVLAEGRIVQAESLADQGRHADAVSFLVQAGAGKSLRNPAYRHVRLWYALGDVSDRAGDLVTAREMFARVVGTDPEAYDARQRLEDLGGSEERKNRPRRRPPTSTKRRVD
jgi:tetratricopeptide (TPR) repeat protein